MKLVVGLGNPGPKYAGHRHNVGFMVIDELLRRSGAGTSSKFKGETARAQLCNEPVVLLKPMTFMNLSGESVGPCARYFDVPVEDTIVVHDELDLDYGDVRIKAGGGHAGHNGLRSIFQHFGKDFARVRFGIGRPRHGTPTAWVLTDFGSDERIDLDVNIDRAADAVEQILSNGIDRARNDTNRKTRKQDGADAHEGETGS